MKNLILSALAVTALAVPAVAVASVDPDFSVEEPRPINVVRRNGVHPIARILLFPILPFVELQSQLQPEKASCWNDRADEVVGCNLVTEIEEAQGSRPTPYTF